MINKQSLWLITLFSLILILGIYYVTMPNDLLKNVNKSQMVNKEITVEVSENDMLVALRVEREEERTTSMEKLESILTDETSSTDEKNNAFEELKVLNLTKGKEIYLEEKILETYNIKSFVEIDGDMIKVVVNSEEHNNAIANNIMRVVQKEFDKKMYITVKFESS